MTRPEQTDLTDLLRRARHLLGPDSDAMRLDEHASEVADWLGSVEATLGEEAP